MSAVIEVRTYRTKPGMRPRLFDLLHSRAFPLQRELGMKVLGPLPSREDYLEFVWLRGFPDEASREPLKAAFYEGAEWLGGLECGDHAAARRLLRRRRRGRRRPVVALARAPVVTRHVS